MADRTPIDLVGQVDISRVKAHVEYLAANQRFNHDRHGEPLGYLDRMLSQWGLTVTGHTYAFHERLGINLVGRKQGADPSLPPFLVCAHYDTVEGSVGADDNASGLAALLECSRVLAQRPLARTLDFVALDMEETQPEGEGLAGSQAFVRDLLGERGYAGVFNLEMVGYTSGPGGQRLPPGFEGLFPQVHQALEARGFAGDALAVVAREGSAAHAYALAQAGADPAIELAVVPVVIPEGSRLPPDLFRSDHAVFWAAGIPALLLTDTADFRNPHYHTAQDTPGTLDYVFLRKVTCTLAAALAALSS